MTPEELDELRRCKGPNEGWYIITDSKGNTWVHDAVATDVPDETSLNRRGDTMEDRTTNDWLLIIAGLLKEILKELQKPGSSVVIK